MEAEKIKRKRPEFYIIEYQSYGYNRFRHLADEKRGRMAFFIKAKTKKRILEILNEKISGNTNMAYLNDYCYELSQMKSLVELMKDYSECVAYGYGDVKAYEGAKILKDVL